MAFPNFVPISRRYFAQKTNKFFAIPNNVVITSRTNRSNVWHILGSIDGVAIKSSIFSLIAPAISFYFLFFYCRTRSLTDNIIHNRRRSKIFYVISPRPICRGRTETERRILFPFHWVVSGERYLWSRFINLTENLDFI